MLARRIFLLLALLFLLAVLASALAPRQRSERTTPSAGPGAVIPAAQVVQATLPPRRTVRAALGDVVDLTIRDQASDEVEIVDLGVHGPVEPDLPAQLTFTADRTGRFAITLRNAGVQLGTVSIGPAAEPGQG